MGNSLTNQETSTQNESVGRPPTVKPVRYVTLGLSAEDKIALLAFQRRIGSSNLSETLRLIFRQRLMAEGLLTDEPPPETPSPRKRRGRS